jgi:hypothetical protein
MTYEDLLRLRGAGPIRGIGFGSMIGTNEGGGSG